MRNPNEKAHRDRVRARSDRATAQHESLEAMEGANAGKWWGMIGGGGGGQGYGVSGTWHGVSGKWQVVNGRQSVAWGLREAVSGQWQHVSHVLTYLRRTCL